MAANDSKDGRIYAMQLDAKYFQPDFRWLETCTQVATVGDWHIIIGFVYERK